MLSNSEKEEFESDQRTEYVDENVSLIADKMKYSKEGSEPGYAYGDVIYKDTSSGITILSDSIEFDQTTDYVFAYGGRETVTTRFMYGFSRMYW